MYFWIQRYMQYMFSPLWDINTLLPALAHFFILSSENIYNHSFLNSFIVHLSNHKTQFWFFTLFHSQSLVAQSYNFVIKTYTVIHTKASDHTPITQILIIICWLLLCKIITFYFWRFFYFQHILHIYITGHNCISQTLETSTQSVQGCTWFT